MMLIANVAPVLLVEPYLNGKRKIHKSEQKKGTKEIMHKEEDKIKAAMFR